MNDKNMLFLISMELSVPDLLKWCSSEKRILRDVCIPIIRNLIPILFL